MKLGVLGDTHDRLDKLKESVDHLKKEKIDTIVHLGDFVSPFTIPLLDFKNIYAVFGNNDGDRLFLQKKASENGFQIQRSPYSFELRNKKILIMHEPFELESYRKSGLHDIILFGHTHRRYKEENPLTVNPGELCGWLENTASYAVIDIENLTVEFYEV